MNASVSPFTEPEQRSLELLASIIEANPWAESLGQEEYEIKIRVQGQSKRWYIISATRFKGPMTMLSIDPSNPWNVTVQGGARKRDVIHKNQYCANLCLNIRHASPLPVGDQLAALGLSLHNDLTTAMTIPLLAQFLICPREELAKIMVFQDEMVVFHSMAFGNEGPFGAFEDYDEFDEEPDNVHGGWDETFSEIEPSESVPSPQEVQTDRTTVEASPPFHDPPQLSEEELAEQRMWEAYEQHREELTRNDGWDDGRR
jgi:hypothetical protein